MEIDEDTFSHLSFYEEKIPSNLHEEAEIISAELLPAKSKLRYESCYITFKTWKNSKKATATSEEVIYFNELSKTVKPPTLWCTYSMLKTMINNNEQIDIKQFAKLQCFLKRKSEGYRGTKAKVFSAEELETFFNSAPDYMYLAVKVVAVFGIAGACRKDEITNIKVQHVEKQGDLLLITIPDTKTKIDRKFAIDGQFRDIINKYALLRPKDLPSDRFLLNYQKGHCTKQVIGKNKIAKMAYEVAEFLNVPEPHKYTSHSFRRTSATLLADAGADLRTIKQHGGWKSDKVAEGYVENSTNNKRKIGNLITANITLAPSTSTTDPNEIEHSVPKRSKIETACSNNRHLSNDISSTSNSSTSSTNIFELNKQPSAPVLQIHDCQVNIYYK